jgi:hypothetical protein
MHGKGRVFVCGFGDDAAVWELREVPTMWLEAIEWALRLTDADVTPRPMPKKESPGDRCSDPASSQRPTTGILAETTCCSEPGAFP